MCKKAMGWGLTHENYSTRVELLLAWILGYDVNLQQVEEFMIFMENEIFGLRVKSTPTPVVEVDTSRSCTARRSRRRQPGSEAGDAGSLHLQTTKTSNQARSLQWQSKP